MKFFKFLLLVFVIAAGVAVAASIASKRKFAGMSDDEIRGFLAGKLDGKVAEDQLKSIQDAVIAGVRASAKQSAPTAAAEGASADDDAAEEVTKAVAEVVVDVIDGDA